MRSSFPNRRIEKQKAKISQYVAILAAIVGQALLLGQLGLLLYAAAFRPIVADEMRRRGQEPVWAAEETNLPSMRLAAKLGFFRVDGLVLFRLSART